MNNIIVVDEQDNIIDYKPRNFVDEKSLRYRTSALWLKNSKNEFLLAKRALTKKHSPGKWGPAVAGTVEEGESYEDNIIKETKEELGITLTQFNKGPKTKISNKHKFFAQWFLGFIDKPANNFKIQDEEVAEVKWFSIKELEKLLKSNPQDFIGSMHEIAKLFN